MRRRLLLLFAVLAAGLFVAIVTLPFWLGAATRWVGASYGVTFARYERIGYTRFAFHDIEVRRANVRVTASRAEASTPLLWAWRHWRGGSDEIAVERWLVDVQRPARPRPVRPDTGWLPLRARLQRIAGHLERWLRRGDVGPGVVRWPGGELSLASARWRQRELAVERLAFRQLVADGTARFAEDADRIDVSLRQVAGRAGAAGAGPAAQVDASAAPTPAPPVEGVALTLTSVGTAVTGDLVWLEQRAPIAARFSPRGWLPHAASISADEWKVPGEYVRLKGLYADVRGGSKIEWNGENLLVDVRAHGEPVEGKSTPPLDVTVRGRGTPRAFTIEVAEASLPGLQARLSAPVTIDRSGRLRDGDAARFTFSGDLAKQPWFEATGRMDGDASLVSGLAESPVVEFRMHGRDLIARGLALSQTEAQGRFHWPVVEIAKGMLAGREGERLELRGGWDFRRKQVLDAHVEGRIRRESVARWLPAQPQFDLVAIRARAVGPVAELEHTGDLRVDALKVAGLNPLAATVEWQGRGIGAESFRIDAAAGQTRLQLAGAADRTSVRIAELNLSRGGAVLLGLAAPTELKWKPTLALQSLHLAGPEGRLDGAVLWGASGRIEASARNFSSAWLADLVALKGPPWRVDLLALTGNWDHGPMTYALTVGATVDLGDGRTAAVNTATRGDKDGLRIEALRATEGGATVLNAVGRLPLTLQPGSARLLRLDEKGALVLDATAAPHSAFWPKLAAATGIELKDPKAELHLKGTWDRPQGSVDLNAARVVVDPKRLKREIPAVESLALELDADPGGVNLTAFSVLVEGQRVRASGRLPVSEGRWTDVVKQPRVVLERDAVLHLEVPDAEVAVFTRFLPAVLAPKGRFAVDLKYQGGSLNGSARLRDAASRPLGPLGVLQEVNAEVEMSGRKVTIRSLGAKSGGQPVALTGSVELPAGGAPRYDLALRGENLPFIRQTGLLLRGNLDLKLQTPREGPTRITGVVKLRDSLFLQDVRAFLPRGGAGPTRRPPYFSVDTPPLNAWALAIEVTGDEFMRLRTPVFNGVASAHLRLGGTLGDPRALGEITIDQGFVRMPFASFEVKQGSVRLTEAAPDAPEIYLRATTRRYRYDLTMEIEGAAGHPNVEFTSSPALDSEQVLLMVMTGAAPSDESTYSGTGRVARIGAFLGQSLLGSLGADTGNAERLTISSGEEPLSRQGKETYDVEYKLSDRWTVTGEYDEYDEFNAGLKWRVLPRAPKREAEIAGGDRKEQRNER